MFFLGGVSYMPHYLIKLSLARLIERQQPTGAEPCREEHGPWGRGREVERLTLILKEYKSCFCCHSQQPLQRSHLLSMWRCALLWPSTGDLSASLFTRANVSPDFKSRLNGWHWRSS